MHAQFYFHFCLLKQMRDSDTHIPVLLFSLDNKGLFKSV